MNRKADLARATGSVPYEARLFKAGNSLAVRIPAAIAKHLDLSDGGALQLSVDGDVLCLRRAPSVVLEDLIGQISADNLHEPMFEDLVGSERW